MSEKKKIVIIGAGIAGLSAASFLSKAGYEVKILEKNKTIGGRARVFDADGFSFDMGPSWYWMPEVFENFYNHFGFKTEDFYKLERLEPSYKVFWEDGDANDIPSDLQEFKNWFESLENGSSKKLDKFLEEAKYKYEVGMNDLVFKPGQSILEFVDVRIAKGLLKLHLLSSFSKYIRKYFKHPKIISLLEFPVLFLGAMPKDTPALYSLMNYADISLGTWYPQGGMGQIIEAFATVAKKQGVEIICDAEVHDFSILEKKVNIVKSKQGDFLADIVVSAADYRHTDLLLGKDYQNYSNRYWESRTMAPSSLLFYLGLNKKVEGLEHHNLFFDAPFENHAIEIYEDSKWPKEPLFYICCPSKTDKSVAPEGCENVFILMPLAPDLEDNAEIREVYFEKILKRLTLRTGIDISKSIVYKKSYCINDFKADYHAFKGNAYGLANTLKQTAILKPGLKNKKLKNFYYTGQLTVPGPGLPPSIISGEVVANFIVKEFK